MNLIMSLWNKIHQL